VPDPLTDTRAATVEEAFLAGRPHDALAALGASLGNAAGDESLSDAIAVLHRTHGIGAAGGALALAEAAGAPADELERHRAEIEAHTMQRLLPEVLGRILFLALGEPAAGPGHDPERWPDGPPVRSREDMVSTIRYLAEHAEQLEWAADRLDPDSREVLVQRLVYLVLDHRRARLGPPMDELARLTVQAREHLLVDERVRGLGYMDAVNRRDFLYSHRFDLAPIGFPISLESSMFGVQATYQLQQYRAPNHPEARPREGDVVIDGGGYLGETALWLAHLVGPSGHVRTFELEAGALAVLRENLHANPALGARIAVDERALWDVADEELSILVSGPGTTIDTTHGTDEADAHDAQRVRTTTIDALVADGELPRVDFVKLDVEGAEPQALAGATETLRHFTPRMALAAYHRFDDMWALMRQIDALDLGYRFALAHFTPHHEETVLYAWVPQP
jgi:FkbM family methyltransferase